MVRKVVGIAVAFVVVILFAVFLLPSFGGPPIPGLQTSIFVGTPQGEILHFAEGTNALGLPTTSIVQVGGTQITYIRWLTTYTAASADYAQYTVVSSSSVKVQLFALLGPPLLPPKSFTSASFFCKHRLHIRETKSFAAFPAIY